MVHVPPKIAHAWLLELNEACTHGCLAHMAACHWSLREQWEWPSNLTRCGFRWLTAAEVHAALGRRKVIVAVDSNAFRLHEGLRALLAD